jgi:hypothetical protein
MNLGQLTNVRSSDFDWFQILKTDQKTLNKWLVFVIVFSKYVPEESVIHIKQMLC